jgi:uncharacterized protein
MRVSKISASPHALRFVDFLARRSRLLLLGCTLLTAVCAVRAVRTYANLRSELEELLPETALSVTALAQARQRLPGLRHLGIVVDSGKPENSAAALRFLSDLEGRIAAYPPNRVAQVHSGVQAERRFLETYAAQLADPADLRRLHQSIAARKRWELSHALTDLLDDEEDPPPAIVSGELIAKYRKNRESVTRFPDDRFLSADALTAVLVVQTASEAASYAQDLSLLAAIREDVQKLGFPAAYAPELRLGFAGDVASRIEETQGLVADLGLSSAVVLGLVLAALYWFYRSWRAWPLLLLPVAVGAVLTFGLVALPPLSIHSVNSNTAFLASIIVGNGINSGIILLSRVQEQVRKGEEIRLALATAITETAGPTLAAALAAGAAYGSLTLTDFRGFQQFGWIGGLGMPVCWLATYGLGSLLILRPSLAIGPGDTGAGLAASLSQRVGRHPRAVLVGCAVWLVFSIVGISRRTGDWLETDFSRLRRADSFESGERYWGKRMDATLQRYLTPTVVMTPSASEAEAVATAARQVQAQGGAAGLIARVHSASSVLPPSRGEALAELQQLARVVSPGLLKELPAAERDLLTQALSPQALQPVTPEDVPPGFAAGLLDRDGHFDRNVLIFPKLSSNTWRLESLSTFARDVRGLVSQVSPGAVVTGHLLLSSDIVSAMREDGPRATAIALATTLALVLLAFRSTRLSLLAVLSLVVGVTLMLGLGAWTGQRLNFTNFITLPITFGIAADYSINVLRRCQGSATPLEAVAQTGGAVGLCSLTTVIGFGSLLVAQNRALLSFGALAVAGELTCLATAVLALPAYVLLRPQALERRP